MSRVLQEYFDIHQEFSQILKKAKSLKTSLEHAKMALDSSLLGFGAIFVTPFFYPSQERRIAHDTNIEIGQSLENLIAKGLHNNCLSKEDWFDNTILFRSLIYLRDCFAKTNINHHEVKIALGLVKNISNSTDCHLDDFFSESKEARMAKEISDSFQLIILTTNNSQIFDTINIFNDEIKEPSLKIKTRFLEMMPPSRVPSYSPTCDENFEYRALSLSSYFSQKKFSPDINYSDEIAALNLEKKDNPAVEFSDEVPTMLTLKKPVAKKIQPQLACSSTL